MNDDPVAVESTEKGPVCGENVVLCFRSRSGWSVGLSVLLDPIGHR